MSSTPKSPSSPKINTKHVTKRSTRLNKAQQKAIEKRASETRWDDSSTAVTEPLASNASSTAAFTSQGVAVATRSRRPVQQGIYLLSRAQELAYIRADMRRLLIIAGVLLLFMLVLLFIVE